MRVGSLFAGIGGFDLGLERAGMHTVWQVEKEPFRRAVLARHFPDAERFEDVREVGAHNLAPVDLICGGFPCQDISLAGAGAGIDGARSGLWAEFARIIGELEPRWVVVENVPALTSRGLDRVLRDLAQGGYDAEWDCIPALALGAPHRRDRLCLVAYPSRDGEVGPAAASGAERQRIGPGRQSRRATSDTNGQRSTGGRVSEGQGRQAISYPRGFCAADQRRALRPSEWWLSEPDVGRVASRISPWMDGGGVGADAQSDGTREVLRAMRGEADQATVWFTTRGLGGVQAAEILLAALCESEGAPEPLGDISLAGEATSEVVMRSLWFNPKLACSSCRRRAEEQRAEQHPDALRVLPQLLACDCGATRLDPSATATASRNRVDRLAALGDALVPQIAEWIGRRIMDYEQAERSEAANPDLSTPTEAVQR